MAKLLAFIYDYKKIEPAVKNSIASEFFIQMVNATFMTVLPLYMEQEGFSKAEIGLFITFRFLGVFALAIPLGRYIKGRNVIRLFYISNICVPLFGLAVVITIYLKFKLLVMFFLLLWGASFTFIQIPILPFILRNSDKKNQTAAISLSYSTWSFGGIISGSIIAILGHIPGFVR